MDNQESPVFPEQNQNSEENKTENQPQEQTKEKEPSSDNSISLGSRKRWFWIALIITLLNPVFAGLILGVFFLNEKDLKKEGKIILALAIVFGFIHGYLQIKLMPWMIDQGFI